MGLYTTEQIELLASGKALLVRSWEFRFASQTMYVWNGNVDRKLHDENVFKGFRGQIIAPDFPFSGAAENETALFQIHGMPADIEALIWDEKNEVDGRYIIERFALFTAQLIETSQGTTYDALDIVGPSPLSQIYVMRGPQSDQEGATVESQPNFTINLMVESIFSTRSEAGFGRYTESDQKGRYPSDTDRMFNYVPILARGLPLQLV